MAKWLYPLVGLIYILLFSVGCSALVLDKNTPIEENKEDISELLFKKTPPKPILVTDIKTSSNLFPNKIEISWSNTAVGVYYSKIFWFDDYDSANAFQKETIKCHYTTEEFNPNLNSSNRLSRNIYNYTHTLLTNDPSGGYIKSGSTYYYVIRLYDIANVIVGYSDLFVGSTANTPYDLIVSRNFRPANEGEPSKIELSWKWDEPQNGFNIYKKEYGTLGVEYKKLTNIDIQNNGQNSFFVVDNIPADCVGKTYLYKITAILENGNESSESSEMQGRTILAGAPEPPTHFSASKGLYKDTILLEWTAPEESDVDSYTIYYRLSSESQAQEKELPNITSTSYLYKPERPEERFKEYNFYVVAVNEKGKSAPCQTQQAGKDFDSGYIIPQVRNFNASFGTYTDKIQLSWAKIRSAEVEYSYTIYRCHDINETPQKIAENISENITNYIDSDSSLEEAKLYFYSIEVVAKNSDSIDSNIGYATDIKDAIGVKINIPTPEILSVSKNQPDITISFKNKPSYCYAVIEVSRPIYAPRYELKPGRSGYDPTKPKNYTETLQYKCNPSRYYSSYSILAKEVSQNSYIDTTSTPGINKYRIKYYFKAPDEIGGKQIFNDTAVESNEGYRSINDREFLTEALKTVDKSQYHLTNIHKSGLAAGAFDSIGKCNGKCEDKKDRPDAGCFHYCYMGAGPPVEVYLRYNMYQAYDMIFESVDTKHLTSVNWGANGSLTGYINISGIYSGRLDFNLVITNAVKAGGSYSVTQTGKQKSDFAWDFDREDVENYLRTL